MGWTFQDLRPNEKYQPEFAQAAAIASAHKVGLQGHNWQPVLRCRIPNGKLIIEGVRSIAVFLQNLISNQEVRHVHQSC
jgi:hypothetical protein